MASTVRGAALLKFGTITLATYVVQAQDLDKKMASFEVYDEDGQGLTEIENFELIQTLSLTVIPLATAVEPALASSITFNGIIYTLKELKRVNNIKQVEMWTLTLRRITGITYT